MTLKDIAGKIIERIGSENISLKENTKKMQTDGYNCGVYVLVFLKRITGRIGTFEKLSITEDNTRDMRQEIVADLVRSYVDQSQESVANYPSVDEF